MKNIRVSNFQKILIVLVITNLFKYDCNGQWQNFGGNLINSTEYLGAAIGSTVPLEFRVYPNNLPINFYTNYSNVSSTKMTLTAGGQLGIGIGYTPNSNTILDISPSVTNQGYGINGSTVLHNWGTNNILSEYVQCNH